MLHLGDDQTIEFDKVITNIGQAYDPRHGHFTAPVSGMYLISASVMSLGGNHVYTDIVRNGNVVASLYAGGKDSVADTSSIVLDLQAGDMIWVRHRSGSSHASEQIDVYNSYMAGFLIKQHT